MAARRLLLVMVVLLVASSLAAALVPVPEPAGEETTTTTSSAPPTAAAAEPLNRTLRADRSRPATVRLRADQPLALTVTGNEYGLVEIPRLGLSEDLDRGAPARFDLLLSEPGTYPVVLSEERIGTLEVTARSPRSEAEPRPG